MHQQTYVHRWVFEDSLGICFISMQVAVITKLQYSTYWPDFIMVLMYGVLHCLSSLFRSFFLLGNRVEESSTKMHLRPED